MALWDEWTGKIPNQIPISHSFKFFAATSSRARYLHGMLPSPHCNPMSSAEIDQLQRESSKSEPQKPKLSVCQHDAPREKSYTWLHGIHPSQNTDMQKIVHEITFRLHGEDVHEIWMNSMFRMHPILKVPLYINTDIPKSEKYLKSKTEFISSISDKGDSPALIFFT